MNKELGRIIAQGYYGFQQVRISQKNRMRDIIYKTVENISFDDVQEKKEKKEYENKYSDKELLEKLETLNKEGKIEESTYDFLLDCWHLIIGTKDTVSIPCKHCGESTDYEDIIEGIQKTENQYKKLMLEYIQTEPIYKEFLAEIRGIGTILSANLIKSFGDCSQYSTVSKLWAHCGLHVVDGKAPKREKDKKINYNLKLRTLTWNISDSLMKQNKGIYRKLYDEEKEKQSKREYEEGFLANTYNGYKKEDTHLSKGHAHNRALRKMRKLFLSHYWEASRKLAGLPTEHTYVEGVLKHAHIISWDEALESEGCLNK